MTDIDATKQPTEGVNYYVFILFCICIALALIAAYIVGLAPTKKGELVDCDCYMHLIRASNLYHNGQWYHPVLIQSNAPFGESLHWSRPFDVLLLAGAMPGSLFVDFETALFWWGVILSPVLMIFAMIALNWATRVVLSKDGTFLVILFFLAQAVVRSVFQPGRPDHHGLLLLFFVIHLGFMLRLVAWPIRKTLCYWAAAASAMSIWVSVESMVPTCISIVVLGLFWIVKKEDYCQKCVHYTLGLFVFCGLFLMAERPFNNLTRVKFDSISVVYVTILAFITAFWGVAWVLNRWTLLSKKPLGRLIYSIFGTFCIGFLVWFFFPKLFHGPFADVDLRIIEIWFYKTREIQSLLSISISSGAYVQLLGLPIVSFSFLFYILFIKKDIASRNAWIYIVLSSILFFSITLYQIRWSIYSYTLFSIVMAELLWRLINYKNDRLPIFWRVIKNSLIMFVLTLGLLYIDVFIQKVFETSLENRKYENPPLSKICDFLNSCQSNNQQSQQIMICPFFATEILYRTDYTVVATANTYGQGILDTYDVMTAKTDDAALEILQNRQTDMILLCPNSSESNMYVKPDMVSTFYDRLLNGQIPAWLKKVQLPENLSDDFLVYETNFSPH